MIPDVVVPLQAWVFSFSCSTFWEHLRFENINIPIPTLISDTPSSRSGFGNVDGNMGAMVLSQSKHAVNVHNSTWTMSEYDLQEIN